MNDTHPMHSGPLCMACGKPGIGQLVMTSTCELPNPDDPIRPHIECHWKCLKCGIIGTDIIQSRVLRSP